MRFRIWPVLCLIALVGVRPAEAKRSAPTDVAPVVVGQVEYSAPHDAMGFVVATDIKTHRELWRKEIYRVTIDPKLERDVQDVFIKSLVLEHGKLTITNERGKRYALDLSASSVTRLD